MSKISTDTFKQLWKDKQWKDSDTFNVYVDNPFCVCECKYCIYNPNLLKTNSDSYKRYYEEYLPSLIKDFTDILTMRPIDTVYFGGGTASLMTEEYMDSIFSLIPNFKDIPCKVFECHPATLTKGKIDKLIDNKISYASVGIQSLNMDLLKSQNRVTYNINELKSNIKKFQQGGVDVNCDLLAFMETGNVEDLKQLTEDLENLLELNPDIITIYPMYQRLQGLEKSTKLITKLRRVLMKFLKHHPEYWDTGKCLDLNTDNIQHTIRTNYILTKLTEEEFSRVRRYCSSGIPDQPSYQNVLALGGYNNRKPYSYLGKDNSMYMINNNFNLEIELND